MNIALNNNEKLGLIGNLATMLNSGIPILEAVDSIGREVRGNQKVIMDTLHKDLNEGMTVSASLARFPRVFDKVAISLLQAAEESGTLDTSLRDLVASIKKDIEFNERVKGALVYPLLVMGVFGLVMLLIFIFVAPRIGKVFLNMKVTLPLATKLIINTSQFLLSKYLFILVGLTLLISLTVYVYQMHRKVLLNLIYSLPFFSGLARTIDLAKFCRSLALLLSAGIPITTALELAERTISKKDIELIIKHCRQKVSQGSRLSEGLRQHKHIPGIMISIVEAGERSGTLEKSMQELYEHFEREAGAALKMFTVMLEPVLLVVVGGMVGGIMLSIIAPIYGLIGQITPK